MDVRKNVRRHGRVRRKEREKRKREIAQKKIAKFYRKNGRLAAPEKAVILEPCSSMHFCWSHSPNTCSADAESADAQ